MVPLQACTPFLHDAHLHLLTLLSVATHRTPERRLHGPFHTSSYGLGQVEFSREYYLNSDQLKPLSSFIYGLHTCRKRMRRLLS